MTAALLTLLLAIPPTEMGSLRIVSQPGVRVIWEDVEVGQTDSHGILLIEQIPLGRFKIKLQKPGHVTVTRQVAITPTEVRLAIELNEIPRVRPREPRPEPPPKPRPEPPPAATPSPEPAPAEVPAPPAPEPRVVAPEPQPRVAEPVPSPAPAGSDEPAGPTQTAFERAAVVPGESRSESPPALLYALIAAVILAAGVLLIQARRSRAAMEYRVRRSSRSRHEGVLSDRDPVEAQGGVDFIDHLKKREMDLEKIETEGGVVEVEVTEIRTIEEDG